MKWISVKEKLPDKPHSEVLVTDGTNVMIAWIGNDLKTWCDSSDRVYKRLVPREITHWMPLPSPPELPK